MIEPRIIEKDQMTVLGFSFFGDPFELSRGWTEENEIGRLWSRFMTYLREHGSSIQHIKGDQVSYEIHIYHDETASMGVFEVFVGVEVEKLENVPVEILVKVLPATKYAVFTVEGQDIISDWSLWFSAEWLPSSGYQLAHPYHFQYYDQRFKGLDKVDESAIDVYIPIK